MLIVISRRTKVVEAFLGEYDPHVLAESDILTGTDMQGLRFEEQHADDRFEFVDALTVSLPTDDAGNLESYRRGYWRWIDGQLVKNPDYVNIDEEAKRQAQEREIKSMRNKLWEIRREELIDETLGIPVESGRMDKDKIIADLQNLESSLSATTAKSK